MELWDALFDRNPCTPEGEESTLSPYKTKDPSDCRSPENFMIKIIEDPRLPLLADFLKNRQQKRVSAGNATEYIMTKLYGTKKFNELKDEDQKIIKGYQESKILIPQEEKKKK